MSRAVGWLLFLALLAAVVMWMAVPAEAQAACAPRESAVKQLADEWGETQRSIMLATEGMVYETWAAESGTWTILLTTPEGLSCVMASGVAYERVSVVEGDPA